MPNDSLFHAEANALIKAYQETGGNLPEYLTMYCDRVSCGSCIDVLPLLTQEMGIKRLIVNFKDGTSKVVQNGVMK
jgi:deoxycytidylate deaminase